MSKLAPRGTDVWVAHHVYFREGSEFLGAFSSLAFLKAAYPSVKWREVEDEPGVWEWAKSNGHEWIRAERVTIT